MSEAIYFSVEDIGFDIVRKAMEKQSLSRIIEINHVKYRLVSVNPKKLTMTIQPIAVSNMLTPMK